MVVFIFFAIVSVFLSQQVKINYEMTEYLPSDSETKIGMDIMEKEFDEEKESYLNIMFKNLTEDEKDNMYVVEGPRIERMLGYTNLDSEKGFQFFQKFLKTSGILEELERLGIEEGDTVRMYDLQFDYYK